MEDAELESLLLNDSKIENQNIEAINCNRKSKMSHEFETIHTFRRFSSKINWYVFVLICIFTLGSWIDIAGIWSELSYMVDELPEGWRLPSILTAISQVSQVGPFIFLILKYTMPRRMNDVKIIYAVFTVGAASCLALAFLWNKTVRVDTEKRSIYLYIFNFTLSLLDGMSTLTFLPFVGKNFAKEYVIANYIGESLSSLLPGLLAFGQGLGNKERCVFNATLNTTTDFQLSRPNYSVSVYYLFMFVLLLMSIVAFAILNLSSIALRHRKAQHPLKELDVEMEGKTNGAYDTISELTTTTTTTTSDQLTFETVIGRDGSVSEANEAPVTATEDNETTEKDTALIGHFAVDFKQQKFETRYLLFMAFFVCFVYYGYLPGLLSYSTMPYSRTVFHLSVNLSSCLLPLSIFFTIWSYDVSLFRITIETIIPMILSVYIQVVSAMSPCPPFWYSEFGGVIVVTCWVVSSCMFMRVRCLIATKLEKYGEHTLLMIGFFTILGQVLGGFLIYLVVEILRLFKEKPACSPVDFCINYR